MKENKNKLLKGEQRREAIIRMLSESGKQISGILLAEEFGVSRQVIVQDIALLRARGFTIISTSQGYLIEQKAPLVRVFKTRHSEDETENEMRLIVDCGGVVKDEFVYHKRYGVLRAEINIRSRLDIEEFMNDIHSGKSSLLMNITSGYHYHTVEADSEKVLDIIEQRLWEAGYLAKLQDYEPEDLVKTVKAVGH